jgi:hypothetical protein
MDLSTTARPDDLARVRGGTVADTARSPGSAVSWGAIFAGAAAAASLSLILLILGVGLGLSSVSPWAARGIGAATFGTSTILWLTLTQLLASAMGGYLAGRLRTRWTGVHVDEVYFRDTAHGFLAWAIASLATAALLTSVIGSIVGGGVQAVASAAPGVERAPMGYYVDALFRRDPGAIGSNGAAASTAGADTAERAAGRDATEVTRIFTNVGRAEPLPAEDVRYVGQIVARRTGLSQQDAEQRVADVYVKAQARVNDAEAAARAATDKARKASAYGALWLFVSLLVGAFVASLSATFGGRRRDA